MGLRKHADLIQLMVGVADHFEIVRRFAHKGARSQTFPNIGIGLKVLIRAIAGRLAIRLRTYYFGKDAIAS
jgi:hypothetical protein